MAPKKLIALAKNRGIQICALLSLVLTVSLAGTVTMEDSYISGRLGKFTIKPYRYGLFISEPDSAVFYNFSPYNDYSYFENKRHPLIYWNESTLAQEYLFGRAPILPRLLSVLSYLNLMRPAANFDSIRGPIWYKADLTDNRALISLIDKSASYPEEASFSMTMTFNDQDFLFDQKGELYTNKTTEDIELFRRFYQFDLKMNESTESAVQINPRYLFIINPTTSGILRLNCTKENIKQVTINKELRLIEFELTSKGKRELEVQSYDQFIEARSGIGGGL